MNIHPYLAYGTIHSKGNSTHFPIGIIEARRIAGSTPISIRGDKIEFQIDEDTACKLCLEILENVVSQFSLPAYHSRLKKLTETAARGLLPSRRG